MTSFIPDPLDVPEVLRARNQWVCWRYEAKEGKPGELTKMPYQAKKPDRKASSKGVQTWADFTTALTSASNPRNKFDGIGYVFSEDDPFVGIDLDDVIMADGSLAQWAQPWLAEMNTYAEFSPSGKGIKAIAIGKLPGNGINARDIELYDQGRYFTITGQRLEGFPLVPCDLNGTVDKLYKFAQAKQEQLQHEYDYRRRQAYAEKALLEEAEIVRHAPEGQRNSLLNTAAFKLATFLESGLLEEEVIADTLFEAAQDAGLTIQEIRATLRSGVRAGHSQPRTIPKGKQSVNTTTGEVIDPREWWKQGITLAALQYKHFEPLRWIIEDICPEGVTLVAAKPKSKKSWLAMGAGLAVALNGKAFGRLNVNPGGVLYLDLEGNERRVQSRVRAILGNGNQAWPDNFRLFTEWPRGDECILRLEHYFLTYPDTRIVVVDLLAEIRPPMDPRANQYDYDRVMLVQLNKLAERYGVAIFVIHHTRKAKGEDVFDEVSGTLGINGAVSTLWILSRQPDGHVVLNITGRDIVKDEPLALSWNAYVCGFVIEGTAEEVSATIERRTILDLMDDESNWTPKQIAVELGKSVGAVQQLLRDMLQAGQIDKAGYGKYAKIPGKSGKSSNTSKSRQSGNSYSDEPTLTQLLPINEGVSKSLEVGPEQVNGTLEADSYHSYQVFSTPDFFDSVPTSRRTIIRLYLRSEQPKDEIRARELCEEYGLDFEEAKQHAKQ
jgi:hypothetical protein